MATSEWKSDDPGGDGSRPMLMNHSQGSDRRAARYDHPSQAWVVRHAAWLRTRFPVKSSGKTAHYTLHGREYSGQIGFRGETVFYKFSGAQGKVLPR